MGAGPTSINLPFTGIASFSKWPIVTNMGELDADVAILGMPYDQSTQYRSGARFGPRGIRDGSTIYGFALGGAYDPERDEMFLDDRWRLVDCGDVDIVHGDQNQSHENLRHAVRTIVEQGSDAGCPGRRPLDHGADRGGHGERRPVHGCAVRRPPRFRRRASRQPLRAWQPHAPNLRV